jgi:drug/metabolite transporter (DMT)-like permease
VTEQRIPIPTPNAPISAERVPLLAVLLLAMIAVLWGFNWPIMKVGLAEVPPWTFRASASLVSALGLFAIAWATGNSIRVPRAQWKGLAVASVLNMALWNIMVLYGISMMDAGRAGILAYTMPLWATVIGALVLKERLGTRAIIGLSLGMAGMGLLFWQDIDVLAGPPLGPALVVAAAICWGGGTVAIKRANLSVPITVAVGWQHIIGGVPIALVAVALESPDPGEISLWPAMAVVYNMTVTGILCYWAYFKVVSLLPVVASTVGTMMVPVIGVFANTWIFGVQPALFDYIALACVAGAVFLVMTRRR